MRRVAFIILLFCSPAMAQQQDPMAMAQACQGKLLETIKGELDIRAQAISWQRDLVAARARIKELEDKYEPKKLDEKK